MPPAYQGMEQLRSQLSAVRRRQERLWRSVALLRATTLLLAGLWLILLPAGYWNDQPPAALRWALLIAWSTLACVLFFRVGKAFLRRQNLLQTARFIEAHHPDLTNELTNALLLADEPRPASRDLVQQAIWETSRPLWGSDLRGMVSRQPVKRWAVSSGLLVICLAVFCTVQSGPALRGLIAVFAPNRYVPAINHITLLHLTPGDTTCFAGESVSVTVEIKNDAQTPWKGQLFLSGRETPVPLQPSPQYHRYTAELKKITADLNYHIRLGPNRWPSDRDGYAIRVVRKIEIDAMEATCRYPEYTHLETRDLPVKDGLLQAPQGSLITLTLTLSEPVPSITLEFENAPSLPMPPLEDPRRFQATFLVENSQRYRFTLRDRQGKILKQFPETGEGFYLLHAIPDRPPEIAWISPLEGTLAAAGQPLRFEIAARDDYGLADLRLTLRDAHTEAMISDQPITSVLSNPLRNSWTVELPAEKIKDGNASLIARVSVSDNRSLPGLGPQTTQTRPLTITLRPADQVATIQQQLWGELKIRLAALLELQQTARVSTEAFRSPRTDGDLSSSATQIEIHQQQLLDAANDLAKNFSFTPEMAGIRQTLIVLTHEPAPRAVREANTLAGGTSDQYPPLAETLIVSQEEIIDTLQTLLAIAISRPAENASISLSAETLSPQAIQALSELKAKLEQFTSAQKKLLETVASLAIQPPDTFTPQQMDPLESLRAEEDRLEKFMEEAFADFSKLAQQDFSNPAMLKELLAIQCDVTMAADALSKQAVEMAVPFASNAVENAESLTANLEKWLPDEADRERWSMESPTSELNIEQAELPAEVEDLVGDLLEEEEDLFDEMQDITTAYAMSGDQGIGWGATDGPISNMNAQGVTGNQLPNTSELSGRSAEGRTGKATGEYVEDQSVGKGGRRTPTRMTPEPFQAGQVNDTSSEPPGGATGGGKLSGSGSEGLEGPVIPPPLARELERLAGQQASLITRAERVHKALPPGDYAQIRMLQAITLMNRVENDLRQNRYRNALRRREDVLSSLKNTREGLANPVFIPDSAQGSPDPWQEEIADVMNKNWPPAYRKALEEYYRRLGAASAKK